MEILYGFTEQEILENKDMDNFIFDHVDWDLIPVVIKKRVAARRDYYSQKYQGQLGIAQYFYKDSEPVVAKAS